MEKIAIATLIADNAADLDITTTTASTATTNHHQNLSITRGGADMVVVSVSDTADTEAAKQMNKQEKPKEFPLLKYATGV